MVNVSREDSNSLTVNCFSWNAQSLNNKANVLLELIEDSDIDFGFISETWFHSDKNDITALVQDKGYLIRHVRRKNRDKELGGGVGVVIKRAIRHKQVPCKSYSSFEHVMVSVKLNSGLF